MKTTGRIKAICFAVVLVALPAAAQLVSVGAARIIVDGFKVQLPSSEETVKGAFGPAPETHFELADEYSNRVFHWLNLGVVAFSNPRNRQVHAFEFLFSKPPYWHGVEFQGRLVVNDHEISATTSVGALEEMGFKKEGVFWTWRSGCIHVLVSTYDDVSISSIEVGVDQENSVLPRLLQRTTQCKPE